MEKEGFSFKDSREIAIFAARLADQKKAEDIVVFDVSKRLSLTDYFVVLTGTSDVHVEALSEFIQEEMEKAGIRPFGIEGNGGWILLDYFDIVVHIFTRELRDYYRLEKLWQDSDSVEWK